MLLAAALAHGAYLRVFVPFRWRGDLAAEAAGAAADAATLALALALPVLQTQGALCTWTPRSAGHFQSQGWRLSEGEVGLLWLGMQIAKPVAAPSRQACLASASHVTP